MQPDQPQPYSPTGSRIGITGMLGILFLALKLIGTIDWSWWFVLMPFYAPVCAYLLFLVSFLIFYMIWGDM